MACTINITVIIIFIAMTTSHLPVFDYALCFSADLILKNVIILWHVDPLLGNDHEISNYTAAIAK
jgi:hypothetical protein